MNPKNVKFILGWPQAMILASLVLAGCSSSPKAPSAPDHSSRYTLSQDVGPSEDFDVSDLEDAQPRYEEPRAAGNRSPYTVWGKQYTVMSSAEGYVQRGTASWYGKKFHGHKTSNGEIYDMYAMSAAHKSLPIPGYAKVTNLDNGRSVVVRVNDRGPFHGDRLIDLSWAAAKKLDFLDRGTARVEVASINVRPDGRMYLAGEPWGNAGGGAGGGNDQPQSSQQPVVLTEGRAIFVQLGAFSRVEPARKLRDEVSQLTEQTVRVKPVDTASGRFHRVQVGPFRDASLATREQKKLQSEGFRQAMILTDSH